MNRDKREGGMTPGTRVVPPSGDHKAWAAHWGDAALRSINGYIEVGFYLDLQHAQRCARLSWWHACRAKGYTSWEKMVADV